MKCSNQMMIGVEEGKCNDKKASKYSSELVLN